MTFKLFSKIKWIKKFTCKYKFSERVKDLIDKFTQSPQLLSSKDFRLTKWILNSQINLNQLDSTNFEMQGKTKDSALKTILKRY